MLSIEPVDRLSRAYTSSPRCNRASARWEPMKPAPPVISTRIESAEPFLTLLRHVQNRGGRSGCGILRWVCRLGSEGRPPALRQLLTETLIIQDRFQSRADRWRRRGAGQYARLDQRRQVVG